MACSCSVKGCPHKASQVGNTEYSLCPDHSRAWGYYFVGYLNALDKNDGRLRKTLWGKAMASFLDWCHTEIVACTQIAEAVVRHVASGGK